jgi:hypothetical protein
MTDQQRQLLLSVGPLYYRKNSTSIFSEAWKYRNEVALFIPFTLLEEYGISGADIFANRFKCTTPFIKIEATGIWILPGYCWDGASGPTVDDRTNMIAALIHDLLYQLMRLGVILHVARLAADTILRDCAATRVDIVYTNPIIRKIMHARYAAWKFFVWEFADKASTEKDESQKPCLVAP